MMKLTKKTHIKTRKNITWLVVFFYIFMLIGIFFLKDLLIFLKQKPPNPPSISSLKSPCRGEVLSPKNQTYNKNSHDKSQQLIRLTEQAISWIFKDIYGQVIDLHCIRNKKMLMIHFWATWCPSCIQELAELSHLAQAYKHKIEIIIISTESLSVIQKFFKESFPDISPYIRIVRMDAWQKLQYFPKDKLPVSYIFNKRGLLEWKQIASQAWSDPKIIKKLLQFY